MILVLQLTPTQMTVTQRHSVRPWPRGHHSSTCGVRRCLCSFGLLQRISFVLVHNNNRSNCVTAASQSHRGPPTKSPQSQGIVLSHLLLIWLTRATHSDSQVIFLEGSCCAVIWSLLQSSDPATATTQCPIRCLWLQRSPWQEASAVPWANKDPIFTKVSERLVVGCSLDLRIPFSWFTTGSERAVGVHCCPINSLQALSPESCLF